MAEENEKQERENEEPEYEPWGLAEALAEMFTNKDFLEFANRSVDKLAASVDKLIAVLKERVEIEKERSSGWGETSRLFLWHRFSLSFLVLAGLGAASWFKLIPTELIAALLTAVVGSLFVPPRKE